MFGRQIAILALIFSFSFALLAFGSSDAFAARGGGGKKQQAPAATGTFSLVLLNSTDGLPHWGQDLTFSVSSTATYPSVLLQCYQGAALVYQQGVGFWPGYPWTQTFTLKTWLWTGAAADCNATLYSQNSDGSIQATLATMSFHVDP